ncbi:hypothetical protein [Lacihabitans sp. CS3-21]|uniref:hypothetical protein n=1 Tax=Lacihabitans sp. CS3-21 TaxID=2487332 RepID=UPI0020CB9D29|nr:hypothetical protein [Lacihabitans sp. CS3-21]MCP9745214.1 hypothetical protein [Lacihabitans sp. CS3-21]
MTKNRGVKAVILILFILIVIFHFLVIFGIVPFQNVWGGRLKTQEEMLKFEAFSIVLNLIFIAVVLVKSGFWKVKISPKIISLLLWIMTILFALNTIGNLFAVNNLEKYIATPITFILSFLCFILAREK